MEVLLNVRKGVWIPAGNPDLTCGRLHFVQVSNYSSSAGCFLKDVDPLLYDLGNGLGAANQCGDLGHSLHFTGHLKQFSICAFEYRLFPETCR